MPLSHAGMLIRVDAGIDEGTKRIESGLALANEFQRRGGQTTMVVSQLPNSLRRKIESNGHRVDLIGGISGGRQDAAQTQEIIDRTRPDWLAIGGGVFDSDYVRSISKAVEFVILTDGIERSANSDLLVGDPLGCDVVTSPVAETHRLPEPQFALVDPSGCRPPIARKIVSQAKRILVWNDGPDVDNWTLRTLQALSDLNNKRLSVECVVTREFCHLAELESFKRHSKLSLRVHRNVDRVESLAERTDLAIANGHPGCYRLAYLGVPLVLVTTPESNLEIIDALHRYRAATSVSHWAESTVNHSADLVKVIRGLVGDQFRRHSMSRHGMGLVDGQGPERVLNRMLRCMISIRRATSADDQVISDWRCHPETQALTLERDREGWCFAAQNPQQDLPQNGSWVWLAETTSGIPVGAIKTRFECSGTRAIVEVTLGEHYRSKGTEAVLFQAVAEKLFGEFGVEEIVAQVRADNKASERSLRSAGFVAIAPTVIAGIMASQLVLRPESVTTATVEVKTRVA